MNIKFGAFVKLIALAVRERDTVISILNDVLPHPNMHQVFRITTAVNSHLANGDSLMYSARNNWHLLSS